MAVVVKIALPLLLAQGLLVTVCAVAAGTSNSKAHEQLQGELSLVQQQMEHATATVHASIAAREATVKALEHVQDIVEQETGHCECNGSCEDKKEGDWCADHKTVDGTGAFGGYRCKCVKFPKTLFKPERLKCCKDYKTQYYTGERDPAEGRGVKEIAAPVAEQNKPWFF